ncbi:hypothetical protein C4D60_Mb10t08120 [Musa balbisiana]|uniref:Uncharacterized protein n=1 Tax=Musa balbisiana TaxID=52838 RepID=A0A4V4H4N2_MUSBA|nr:hypothetical protein C4D60_Mb10t08120 [Musa balbisiana]
MRQVPREGRGGHTKRRRRLSSLLENPRTKTVEPQRIKSSRIPIDHTHQDLTLFLDPLSVLNSKNPNHCLLVFDTRSWASRVGGGPRRHACERIRIGRNSRPRLCRGARALVEPPDHK